MTNFNEYNHMRRYIQGRMSADEQLDFETQMRSDSFLADAVEGFSSDPGAIDDIPSFGRSGRSWLYTIAGLSFIGLLLFAAAEVGFIQELESDLVEDIIVESTIPIQLEPINAAEVPALLPDKEFTIEPISELGLKINEPIIPALEEQHALTSITEPMEVLDAPDIPSKTSVIAMYQSDIIFIEDLKIVKEEMLGGEKEEPFYFHEHHIPALSERTNSPLSTLQEKYLSQFQKQTYIEELSDALIAFKKGNYDESKSAFIILNKEYGTSINHLFYAGLCAFHLEDYKLAAKELREVRDMHDLAFYEEATWYYACSLQASGKDLEAKKLFEEIYIGDGHYSPMAASRLLRKN